MIICYSCVRQTRPDQAKPSQARQVTTKTKKKRIETGWFKTHVGWRGERDMASRL